jgi:hypothetical protein
MCASHMTLSGTFTELQTFKVSFPACKGDTARMQKHRQHEISALRQVCNAGLWCAHVARCNPRLSCLLLSADQLTLHNKMQMPSLKKQDVGSSLQTNRLTIMHALGGRLCN